MSTLDPALTYYRVLYLTPEEHGPISHWRQESMRMTVGLPWSSDRMTIWKPRNDIEAELLTRLEHAGLMEAFDEGQRFCVNPAHLQLVEMTERKPSHGREEWQGLRVAILRDLRIAEFERSRDAVGAFMTKRFPAIRQMEAVFSWLIGYRPNLPPAVASGAVYPIGRKGPYAVGVEGFEPYVFGGRPSARSRPSKANGHAPPDLDSPEAHLEPEPVLEPESEPEPAQAPIAAGLPTAFLTENLDERMHAEILRLQGETGVVREEIGMLEAKLKAARERLLPLDARLEGLRFLREERSKLREPGRT